MPITYTGRNVRPGGETAPSLIDIAVGLSRMPRFAGQTRRWWSVLDHTLFADELVRLVAPDDPPALHRAVLLHDAHEAITGDVPSPIKPDALREVQDELDTVIFDAYFPGWYPALTPELKRIDRLAMIAEALVIGPPLPRPRIFEVFGMDDLAERAETFLDTRVYSQAARKVGGQLYGIPPFEEKQERHPAVVEYLNRIIRLL